MAAELNRDNLTDRAPCYARMMVKPLPLWHKWIARRWTFFGRLLLMLFLAVWTLPPLLFMFFGYAQNGIHGAVTGFLLGILAALIAIVLFRLVGLR